uniref:G protein-coupled receptor n=1 Tax=Parascaris univalens TaxID=6257 RepID=A0A915BTG4_PARUN
MAFCVFLCIIAALSYAIIIFTARETFKMLSSTPLSDQTRKLQREMTIGMVLQSSEELNALATSSSKKDLKELKADQYSGVDIGVEIV